MSAHSTICTICGRKLGEKSFPPFCSDRCRVIDLGSWLDGTYQPPWLLDPEEVEALAALEERSPGHASFEDETCAEDE